MNFEIHLQFIQSLYWNFYTRAQFTSTCSYFGAEIVNVIGWPENKVVPRLYSAFKMAAERRGSSLSRHLESGVDTGNEVGLKTAI